MAYISGQQLYETHVEVAEEFLGEPQKQWHELTFAEQQEWQRSADTVNDTDKEDNA